MRRNKRQKRGKMLPFRTIKAASGGDVDAINKVLKHYEGYIVALSARKLFDEQGNVHLVADNEMRRTLETRLITKLLKFDLNRAM